MEQLKACPFCGSDDVEIHELMSGTYIECNGCWINTRIFHSKEEAIEFWNTRKGDKE